MLRVLVLYMVAVLCPPAHAQPVSCKEDAQCSVGYYCETDVHICRECLSCQDLKRKPPLAVNTCIKSVAECGSCINGLVVNRRDDVNAECVPPDTSLEPTPSYVWLLIGIGVLLFLALVVGIIAYLLRYPEIFKTASSNQSSTVTARITAATAPEAPPPYNPLPQSPYHSSPYTDGEPTAYNEDEQFIKRPLSSRPQDARESAGNQAARVYDKPIYDRDLPPPSPESPVPEYAETMTLPIDDEETIQSTWMPVGTTSNGDVNANVVNDTNARESEAAGATLPALLSAAQNTTLVEHSAAKRRCVQQESRDSNSYGDSSHNSFPRSPSPSQGGPPYSYITQITNVVQINTNK